MHLPASIHCEADDASAATPWSEQQICLFTTAVGPCDQYDQSVAIRPQITTALRPNLQKPYDDTSAIFTMSKKCVTIIDDAHLMPSDCLRKLRLLCED